MFERYTEHARRALFFARYEASQLGSIAIDAEHLLLGLLRQPTRLVGQLLASVPVDELRQEISARGGRRSGPLSTSVEIPFTAGTKRALDYAAQEADQLQHGHIGTEHLLLGLLRQEKSLAAALLAARGVRLDDVRAAIAGGAPGDIQSDRAGRPDSPLPNTDAPAIPAMTLRNQLQELVRSLPDDALPHARGMLERMQASPPPRPPITRDEALDRMQARLKEVAERNPGRCFISVGGGGGRIGPEGLRHARHGFGYPDGGSHVHETTIVHANHELRLIERIRLDQEARRLLFSIEIIGPDGTTARHDFAFDVPADTP